MDNNDTTPAPIGPAEHSHDALKAIMLVVLFIVTFLASTASLPLVARAHASPRADRLFSLVSCFGAGVFLATCLLDMLPDAQKSMAQAEHRLGHPIAFPLCAFFIAVGFLLVLLLEQLAHCAFDWFGISPATLLPGGQHRHQAAQQQRRASQEQLVLPEPSNRQESPSPLSIQQYEQNDAEVDEAPPATDSQPNHRRHDDQQEDEQQETGSNSSSHDFDTQLSTMRVFLLLFALMLHACCEGISIGTFTDVSVLFQIFAALLIHKCIVGFSLGLRLAQSNLRPVVVVLCCALFALQVLIGGFLSLAVMDILAGKVSMFLLSAISQSIACGTFLYITTFEILPHELPTHHHQHSHGATIGNDRSRSLTIVSLLAGFALITAFVAIFPDADEAPNDF